MEEGIAGYLFNKLFLRDIIVKHNIRFNTQLHFREDELFVFQYLEHVNHWSSINRTNYIYYVPKPIKIMGHQQPSAPNYYLKHLGAYTMTTYRMKYIEIKHGASKEPSLKI